MCKVGAPSDYKLNKCSSNLYRKISGELSGERRRKFCHFSPHHRHTIHVGEHERTTSRKTSVEKFESAPCLQSQLNWIWNRTWKALFCCHSRSSSSRLGRHRFEWNDISVKFNLMPSGKQTWKAFNEIIKINIDRSRRRKAKAQN